MRVLLIEDDTRLAERTAEYLRSHDFRVEIVGDGLRGLERASSGEHDLVLLDIMLPGIGGLEVCRRLRANSMIPVIMLTAQGGEIDRIIGLELGADDYLPKPYSARELLARIRAVLRRQSGSNEEKLDVGPLHIDRARRLASLGGNPCTEMSAYQFDILWVLARLAPRVVTRKQLHGQLRALRGEPPEEFDPQVDRSLDVHVVKLRQRLAAAHESGSGALKTVRGVGYLLSFDEQPEGEQPQ